MAIHILCALKMKKKTHEKTHVFDNVKYIIDGRVQKSLKVQVHITWTWVFSRAHFVRLTKRLHYLALHAA